MNQTDKKITKTGEYKNSRIYITHKQYQYKLNYLRSRNKRINSLSILTNHLTFNLKKLTNNKRNHTTGVRTKASQNICASAVSTTVISSSYNNTKKILLI